MVKDSQDWLKEDHVSWVHDHLRNQSECWLEEALLLKQLGEQLRNHQQEVEKLYLLALLLPSAAVLHHFGTANCAQYCLPKSALEFAALSKTPPHHS